MVGKGDSSWSGGFFDGDLVYGFGFGVFASGGKDSSSVNEAGLGWGGGFLWLLLRCPLVLSYLKSGAF
jgi:hypothetical protein